MKLITHVSKRKLDLLHTEAVELQYIKDGSETLMAITQSGGIPDFIRNNMPETMAAIEEISELRKTPPLNVMINIMAPGLVIPKHRDWIKSSTHQKDKPIVERWHLPIITNNECRWWGEKTGFVPMSKGTWYGPMPYWQLHNFENNGKTRRIHLVVDLDTPNRIGKYDEEKE